MLITMLAILTNQEMISFIYMTDQGLQTQMMQLLTQIICTVNAKGTAHNMTTGISANPVREG